MFPPTIKIVGFHNAKSMKSTRIIFNIDTRLKEMFEDVCKEKCLTKTKVITMLIKKYVSDNNKIEREEIKV